MSAPEKTPPASGSGANRAANTAKAGVAGAQGAGLIARGATLPGVTAAQVQSRAIAQATAKLVEALAKFAQGRSQTIIPLLTTSLQEQFVDRTPDEIAKLVGREQAREREFLRRQRIRMARDLPGVLREADEAERKRKLEKLLARERHYMRLREQAMTARAHSAVESLDLQEASPEGAMWMLSSEVRNHTPGCLAMAGKFWPWVVLREVMHPPVHPGCPCYLITLDEAVARGLMRPQDIPDTRDALLRARRNMALEEALLGEFGEDAIMEAMLALEEESHAPGRPHVKARRYAKGYEKGGQFMPKLGGSPGALIRHLLPHVHAHPGAGRSRTRGVWMKGHHVNVPEDRQFSRKIGGSHFTSPPGGTNVYRDGHLVSTPDQPSLHPDTTRPRGASARGKVAPKRKGVTVGSAVEDRRKAQARRIEKALRSADAATSPVKVGDTAEQVHSELRVGGFVADEAGARQTADALMLSYTHPDGHKIDVTVNRVSGKVTDVNWTPGAQTDTSKLRSKLGLDKPKTAEKPKPAPERPKQRSTRDEREALARIDHEGILQRTLGTHDATWTRQVDRAKANDGDAQWDLATEASARGPNSDFTKRLEAEVGKATLKRWQRESAPRPLPDDKPSQHYEVKHVAASDHGPTVGVGVHAGTAGGRNDRNRAMGTGHYFTSRPVAGSAEHGVDLQGSRLMRPRDEQQSRGIAHALDVLNGIAASGGSSTRLPDPRTGEMRVFGINDAVAALPHGMNEFDARLLAEHSIERHRFGSGDESAATHMMRGIGFDGVDNRHIPELDHPSFGSVVYEPEHVSTAMPSPQMAGAATAGRSQNGSVVRGVLGRWVWIRGRNKHVHHETEWSREFDGITFSSPAGTTDVYRHEADGTRTLISRVGMPQTDPDARNPRLQSLRRGGRTSDRADPPPPPPAPEPEPPAPPPQPAPAPAPAPAPPPAPTMPRPNVSQGQHVRGTMVHGDAQFDGHVEGMNEMADGRWGVVVRVSSGPQRGRLITLAGHTVGPLDASGPPEGVSRRLSPEARDTIISLGAGWHNGGYMGADEGVSFNENQIEALNASGIPEGQITLGPLWERMTPAERQFTLDHAYGRAMAHSLVQSEDARGDLSNLWTSGAFSGPDGVPLDRYSPEEGVAIAHARMNGENWRQFADAHPDLSRWVAAQAEQRGHAIRPDVLEFIHNNEDNGNVHDPVQPLSNEARALAQSLVGGTYLNANSVLAREHGFYLVPGQSGTRSVFRRIDSSGQVETIAVTKDMGSGNVTAADGTIYAFDPNREPPAGDTPEWLAYNMRGLDAGGQLHDAMANQGYVPLRATVQGEQSIQVWVRHDSDVALNVSHSRYGSPDSHDSMSVDVRPIMLDPTERMARMKLFAEEEPEKAFPEGTTLEEVNSALGSTGWKVTPSEDGRFLNLTKTGSLDDPDRAFVDVRRIELRGSGDDRVVERVGRPGLANRAGMAVDDADAQAFIEAANSGMRQSARERRDRIENLKERLRTEVNAGRMPFTADDAMPDIVEALQESGYRKASERSWQDTGRSVTWKNRSTGAQIITRSKPNPNTQSASRWRTQLAERDAGGVPTNIYVSGRLSDPGVRDEGRNRSPEGAPPVDLPAWKGEILGWSDELGRRYGTEVHNTDVRFAAASASARHDGDHAGYHETETGRINVGNSVKPALETLARARAEGRPLTDPEMRTIHQSYRTIQHEILHGVQVPGSLARRDGSRHGYDFSDGGQGIEEALTEELAGQLGVELMRRHGLEDVIAYVRANPTAHWDAYQTHRAHFDTLLNRMGLTEPEARREAMEQWKFRMNHLERREDMAVRISEHEGIPTDQGRAAVRSVMGVASKEGGLPTVPNFRPVLPTDYSPPDGVPEPEPPAPPPAARYEVGQTVTIEKYGQEVNGVIEQARHDVADGVLTGGWHYLVRHDPIRGYGDTTYWVSEANVRQHAPEPPPEPPPPPPPPPPPEPPRGITTTISDGGVISVGAMVRGTATGKLGQVQSIDGRNITVKREDGSIGTFDGNSWRSVIVTDSGAVLDHGATVTGPGGVTGRITEIDWSDPQNPRAKLTPLSGPEQNVQGRNLTGTGAEGSFNLPLTTRDGSARPANIGDLIRMRDGRTGKLMGSQLDSWPNGTPAYRVQIEGTGAMELVPREGIIGYAHELPRIDQLSGNFTPEQLQALQQAHFDRTDGSALARPMGDALAAGRSGLTSTVAQGFATWAQANGHELPRSAAEVISDVYQAGFQNQTAYDALSPPIRDAVYQLAQEAGLPTPDWVTQRPILPAGIPHGDITDEAVVRAIFSGSFGRSGYTLNISEVNRESNSTGVRGTIVTPTGESVGTFSRRITRNSDGSFAVYNAYLQLQASAQGSGFASAFNKHCFDIYAAKGVREVTVSANIDVGAYTWAATGFDFQAQGTPLVKAEQRARQSYMLAEQARRRGRVSDEEWAAIRPRLWNGSPGDGPLRQDHVQHAWELAYIDGRPSGKRRGTKNIGQKILLGSDVSWSGIRLLGAPPAPREGEAAQGPIPQGRPGGDSVPIGGLPTAPKKLTAAKAQSWLRHNIHEMSAPFRSGMREVATAQNEVHPNARPEHAPTVEVGRTIEVDGIRPAGQYVSDRRDIRLDAELSMENRELVLAREYGNHFYDTVIERQIQRAEDSNAPGYHTGYQQWRALAAEMAGSSMATRNRRRLDQGYISQEQFDQVTSERAMFAKAYASWLTAKSANARMLRQQRRAQRADYAGIRNYSAREVRSLTPLMDALFTALGESGTDTPRVPGLARR